jgi:dethiobiotin synthetase
MKLFITGIGTEIGKTVCSAILVQYFKADYWKPVQSGDLHYTDSHKIETWTDHTFCHPETYRLQLAASPINLQGKKTYRSVLMIFNCRKLRIH